MRLCLLNERGPSPRPSLAATLAAAALCPHFFPFLPPPLPGVQELGIPPPLLATTLRPKLLPPATSYCLPPEAGAGCDHGGASKCHVSSISMAAGQDPAEAPQGKV